MLNHKLLEEILRVLYTDNTGNLVVLNPMLKAGGYNNGDIASTMTYMRDDGMIGGSMCNELNKVNPETRQRFTLDEVEIKTRLFPKGSAYYRDNFERSAQIQFNLNAPNTQVTNTNIGTAINSPISVAPIIKSEGKTNVWEKRSWIIAVIIGLFAIVGYFSDFFKWLYTLLNR